MNQGGLKHAATESRLDNKRERRRGASGRAAALRRAPSDSDCSGETASLSADSGDRAIRPPPPPTRAAKSRSRRRGSEWEVLEGLKDGQRFEKRPDVFNGYLHKKRKWPLKGWHKRFFVVDGGILVYARSPTDVARGRLHGSVDVGLSVISAKARRRRIDIDADEFIYHLRAKTPDVFRTWLNVLKAHRLYRQHLLTFGARESVPKIHAPLEDLPPTDTSSRTSRVSIETSTLTSNEDFQKSVPSTTSSSHPKIEYPAKTPMNWQFSKERKLVFFNFQRKYNAKEKIEEALHCKNRSLCSMNCVAKINLDMEKFNVSKGSTNAEKQMHTTDLESNSFNTSLETKSTILKKLEPDERAREKFTLLRTNKIDPTTTCYFFSRKKRNSTNFPGPSPMRRSKKSTNLVKYKNIIDEPKLKEPISKCLLRRMHRSRSPKREKTIVSHRGVVCDVIPKENNEVQANEAKEHKSLQDLMTVSEYDKITEHLMITLFENHKITHNVNDKEVKHYINQVVKELYDVKFSQTDVHPVKMLFRALLEYWLKNTSGEQFREALRRVKSVHKPSNGYFTQDKILSSFLLANATKQTQFHGVSDFINDYELSDHLHASYKSTTRLPKSDKRAIRCHSPKRDTESFEKERRIQELERVLKNTVYVCETIHSKQSKEKDIQITKQLIANLEKWSKRSGLSNAIDENKLEKSSNSSSEVPLIQEAITHLISETAIPPDIAKEFLSAYLGILLNGSSKSMTQNSSQSSECLKKDPQYPRCDVQSESIQRRASKNITTVSFGDNAINISYTDGDQSTNHQKTSPDSGQLYLRDVLDKITTVFSKANSKQSDINDKSTGDKKDEPNNELGKSTKEYPGKNLIRENYDDNSVVIDLSKYDLDRISMFSDPQLKGVMSITIKLREKSHTSEAKRPKVSLKFGTETKIKERPRSEECLHNSNSHSLKKIFDPADGNLQGKFETSDSTTPNIEIELKPYLSSNEFMPKTYCQIVHESEHSIDLSFKSSNFFRKEYVDESDEAQSCYIVSSLKKNTTSTKTQSTKKKVHVRHNNPLVLGPQMRSANQSSSSRYPDEYSVFEQPTPKIIDEKFILLLFENLTLLSKNLPNLYKDLNTLYLKLRKKHEKVVRTCCNIQGLSLLGRIYNDDLKPNDRCTQYEKSDSCETLTDSPKREDTTVSTSTNLMQQIVTDKSLSTCCLNTLSKITEVQTENTSEVKTKSSILIETVFEDETRISPSTRSLPNVTTAEEAVSVANWKQHIPTKNCAVSTMITAIIDNSAGVPNAFLVRSKHFENVLADKTDKNLPVAKQELIKEFALLSPLIKNSTQSQTDEIFLHKSKDVNTGSEFTPCNNFNVYTLCLKAKEAKSNSTIDVLSPAKEMSDDLKTIYRCKSEPSYCSGLVSPTSQPLRGPQAGFVSGTPGGRLAGWIIESGGPLENASRELGQAQLSVQQLQRLLEALELQQQVHHDTDMKLLAKVEVDVL